MVAKFAVASQWLAIVVAVSAAVGRVRLPASLSYGVAARVANFAIVSRSLATMWCALVVVNWGCSGSGTSLRVFCMAKLAIVSHRLDIPVSFVRV